MIFIIYQPEFPSCIFSDTFGPYNTSPAEAAIIHLTQCKLRKLPILSFCLRHNYRYDVGKTNWTQTHLRWLKSLKPDGLYAEILAEYLGTFDYLSRKIERLDQKIEELASGMRYKENVRKLTCLMGIRPQTALAVITEVGDFNRFAAARHFASYIGLTPGEDSSGENQTRLGITKAGNSHVRRLLIEAAQCYTRGRAGHKSREMQKRQLGNRPEVIAYADRANERLRRRYYRMVLKNNKKANVAKTAIARELACYIWGMLTDNIA